MGVYSSLKSLSSPSCGLENPFLSQVVDRIDSIYVPSSGQYFSQKAELSPLVDSGFHKPCQLIPYFSQANPYLSQTPADA